MPRSIKSDSSGKSHRKDEPNAQDGEVGRADHQPLPDPRPHELPALLAEIKAKYAYLLAEPPAVALTAVGSPNSE